MTTVQTPSGKLLPLMNLKGKDYLAVAYRLVWYREVFPKGKIVTEAIQMTQEYAVFRASVFDEADRLLATATKHESKKDFPDHIEKAETGAIGRALALCGFGTQFTDDLEEGQRIVDSPIVTNRTQVEHQNVALPNFSKSSAVSPSQLAPKPKLGTAKPSEAQISRLYSIGSANRWTKEAVKEAISLMYNKESTKDLTLVEYNAICDNVLPMTSITKLRDKYKKTFATESQSIHDIGDGHL